MKKILVVVDMQNDFIDGALGTAEAVDIVDNAAEKIKNFSGDIFVTYTPILIIIWKPKRAKNYPYLTV